MSPPPTIVVAAPFVRHRHYCFAPPLLKLMSCAEVKVWGLSGLGFSLKMLGNSDHWWLWMERGGSADRSGGEEYGLRAEMTLRWGCRRLRVAA
jgi:hypothetical protein